MKKTLQELAQYVGGQLEGDPRLEVEGISSIQLAGPREITFVVHQRHEKELEKSNACAVIVPERRLGGDRPKIIVPNPYLAYAKIAQLFHPIHPPYRGVSQEALIHPSAELGREVTIYPFVYVEEGVKIGDGSCLFPWVFVGRGCMIGSRCILYPAVVLYPGCILGNNVIVHAGCVLGSDGFGYARDGRRSVKIPQVGRVRIDDDVEIGSNSAVDRASFGETWIQRGVKIDNLVQIGHNVEVGEDSILAGQVGIAGSSRLGKAVILGGQVGVADHVEIGDGALVGAKSGVAQDLPAGKAFSGIPAYQHRRWLRNTKIIPQLPELQRRIQLLERRIKELERIIHEAKGYGKGGD